MAQKFKRRPLWLKVILGISVMGFVLVCGGLAMITFWPDAAAQNIDRLRDVIGDEPVAQLETVVLSVQDHVQQFEYRVGLLHPAAPWANSHVDPTALPLTPAAMPTSAPTSPAIALSNTSVPSPTPTDTVLSNTTGLPPTNAAPIGSTPSPSPTTAPTAMPIASLPAWQLTALTPLGMLAGEGQWSPYLYDPSGHTVVAYRTFLQPDQRRPYSIAAIVAFNLQSTRLHFVLGSVEPQSATPQPTRNGMIPTADLQPGILLAAFNGGFKARHGQYGAMANNLIALPPINGLATVAIHANGQVQIGEWGKDIKASPDLLAWRQNGEMLIHDGQINPDTVRTTSAWGLTVKGEAVTWRSALGLSADGHTLYYVAGQQLDVPTLTKVMAQAGAAEAFQLDVNNFWVHFVAIHSNGSSLLAEPLLPAMNLQADRYLKGYSRDFFYITEASPSGRS